MEDGVGTKKLTQPRKIWNIHGIMNKGGLLTNYVDLDVQTKGIHKEMRFLVADLGGEDLILRYPWLTTFKPQVMWWTATIDVKALPVVLQTVNPFIRQMNTVIASMEAELTPTDKYHIVQELEEQSAICTIATDMERVANPNKSPTDIPRKYQRQVKIFSKDEVQCFPCSSPWDHTIDLKPSAPDTLNRPLLANEKIVLRYRLDEMEAKGYIRPSISPYMSSFFFIKKKGGKPWSVQDYRALNQITIHNNAPLPLIQQTIVDLIECFIFSTIDVWWGYNNVHTKDGDQWKAAFKTCFGLFEPMVIFFGLTNTLPTFYAMMNHIFWPGIDKHAACRTIIRVYMDNIIIGMHSTVADHTAAVHDVLDLLERNDLFLKCNATVRRSGTMCTTGSGQGKDKSGLRT